MSLMKFSESPQARFKDAATLMFFLTSIGFYVVAVLSLMQFSTIKVVAKTNATVVNYLEYNREAIVYKVGETTLNGSVPVKDVRDPIGSSFIILVNLETRDIYRDSLPNPDVQEHIGIVAAVVFFLSSISGFLILKKKW